jgi:hypothetical protein
LESTNVPSTSNSTAGCAIAKYLSVDWEYMVGTPPGIE